MGSRGDGLPPLAGPARRGCTIASHPCSDLDISVLGPLRARRGGADLALGGRRQRAVLARLVLAAGATVGAERLIDELWDGEPPPSAVNTLQSYVSNLRRALGTEVIERAGEGYRLAGDPAALASVRFERLVAGAVGDAARPAEDRVAELDEALALWAGPALADLAHEPWAQGAAVRLEELRLTAMEARFELLLAVGRHAVVVGDVDAAVAAHPLRERFAAQLVLALYRCGRQADALRAYERTRAHLADELGLDPSPELARLAAQVLEHDPALAVPDPPPVAPAAAPRVGADGWGQLPLPPAVAERRARSAFVGRDAEQAEVDGHRAAVAAGEPRLVVISGDAGAGKTRLAQHLARRAHDDGCQVLWGRCSAETLISYQPVVEALRTAVRALGPAELATLVAPRPALGLLLPDLLPAPAPAGRTERYDLYEALADLAGAVSAEAPVVLVVDDLQWADGATLSLLEHLLAGDRTGRLLVLGTVRRPAGRATVELDGLLAQVRRAGRLGVVELAGLDDDAVAALLASRGAPVDAATAAAVAARTGGNPFFVEALAERGGDLLADGARDVPESVRDLLDQRLAALEPETARVLAVAAVVGLRVDLALLGAVADLDPDALLDAVDAAVAAGLLVEDEELGWVSFPHALVRQALVARTTRNREAQVHLRVADALGASEGGADRASTVASHLLAAGRLADPERAAAAALAAGREALAVLADAEARAWARRALDVAATGPDGADAAVEAHLLVAAASRNLAERPVAAEAIGQVAAEARRRGDGLLLFRAAQERALLQAGVGFSFGIVDDDLVALLDEALAALPPDRPAERALLLAWSAIALTGSGDPAAPRPVAAEALALAAEVEGRPDVTALAAYARRHAVAGPAGLEERLRLGPVMVEAAAAAAWPELEAVGRVFGAVDLLEADRVEAARAVLAELKAGLGPTERPMFDTYVHFLDGGFLLLRGDLDAAERASTTAITMGEPAHGTNAVQGWGSQQFMLAWYRGHLPDLRPLVEQMVADIPDMPVWRAALGACLVAAGDPEGAVAAIDPLLDADGLRIADDLLWYTSAGLLAEVCWAVGDAERARPLAAALGPVADRVGTTGMGTICLGHLARHHGLALATVGDLDTAEAELARAAARAQACGFGPWEARARVERAVVLERRGGPGDAEEAERERAAGQALGDRLGIRLALAP